MASEDGSILIIVLALLLLAGSELFGSPMDDVALSEQQKLVGKQIWAAETAAEILAGFAKDLQGGSLAEIEKAQAKLRGQPALLGIPLSMELPSWLGAKDVESARLFRLLRSQAWPSEDAVADELDETLHRSKQLHLILVTLNFEIPLLERCLYLSDALGDATFQVRLRNDLAAILWRTHTFSSRGTAKTCFGDSPGSRRVCERAAGAKN